MSLQQGFSGLPAQGARPGSWAWEKNVKQLQSCEIEGGAHVGRANPPTSAALRPSHQPTRKMGSSSKWHLIGSWDFLCPRRSGSLSGVGLISILKRAEEHPEAH